MDFALDATAAAVAEVANDVFGRLEPEWSQKFTDAPGFDGPAWSALRESGVLALAQPAAVGGDDVGPAGLLPLLQRMGRSAAVTPALGTLAAQLVLQKVDADVAAPWTERLAQGWATVGTASSVAPLVVENGTLSGTASGALHADGASLLLVAASDADAVYAVDPTTSGVSLTRTFTSSGWSEYTVTLDVAAAQPLGVSASTLHDAYRLVLGGYADGLVAGATRLTADHVSERTQFGKPIALFQAVGQQLADIYVIGRSMNLATTAAAWRLNEGLDATVDLAIGAYWMAAEIPATLRTMTHLHGGVGVDITYPLHRYFSIAKDLARLVGGPVATLDELADALAAPASATAATHTDTSQFIDLTDDQRALKAQVREYFADLISADDAETMLTERHGPTYRKVIAQMGRDGWLGVGWPKEFGGKGFGDIEQQIFTNEAVRADVPLPSVTLQTVGPTLQTYGTQEQKQKFLPDILAGQVHFAIGYTEPDAGTDLASLTTAAVLDGDHYVVNGQKIFTTGGHDADYIWLAVRTDKDAPKHKGISILIVDTKDPGFSWTPIITADGAHHVNATYYNDVKVPVGMRVGEEGDGWKLITTQLNHERVMLGPSGRIEGLARRVADWVDQRSLRDEPDVRRTLAQIDAYARINELLNWQVASTGEAISMADAAATKVFATERIQVIGRLIDDLLGRYGDYTDEATGQLARWLDAQQKRNVVITFGGGVNEVMRDMIATAGLGLPRAKR